MARTRDPAELKAALHVQIKALEASCASYDQGDKWEALRLATSTYMLLHDSGRNANSILSQLGLRESIAFISSGGRPKSPQLRQVAEYTLAVLRFGPNSVEYKPRLGSVRSLLKTLNCKEWWEHEIIFYSADKRHTLTRKDLVRALRDQEGGSHFDSKLTNQSYVEAAYGDTWIREFEDGTKEPIKQAELASMRQIAWELLETLKSAGFP